MRGCRATRLGTIAHTECPCFRVLRRRGGPAVECNNAGGVVRRNAVAPIARRRRAAGIEHRRRRCADKCGTTPTLVRRLGAAVCVSRSSGHALIPSGRTGERVLCGSESAAVCLAWSYACNPHTVWYRVPSAGGPGPSRHDACAAFVSLPAPRSPHKA